MNRQRSVLLLAFLLIFFSVSGWMIYHEIQTGKNTFLSGAPPQEIQDVIVPQELDASQLHPPALLATDYIRYGSPTSSASVIEYGDFQCDSCRTMSPILNKVIASYGGKIRLVWHDLPITTQHPKAVEAAVFARCAGNQGRFWEAHDELMRAESLNELTLGGIADRLHLDLTQTTTCRTDPTMTDAVLRDMDIARGDGISRAPTIFVGTKAYIGPLTEKELRTAIDAFLRS